MECSLAQDFSNYLILYKWLAPDFDAVIQVMVKQTVMCGRIQFGSVLRAVDGEGYTDHLCHNYEFSIASHSLISEFH